MQIFQVLGLERYRPAEHSIKEDAQGPDVHEKALVTFIYDDFWGEVGWGTTLLLDDLAFFYDFGDTKVTIFNSFLAI